MYKVSYTGNGTTTEFFFAFPYFENSNIVVTKNGAPATGYSIIGNSGGENANYPYTGGKVVFNTALSPLDNIVISRQLPLSRIVDYQPTARIEPTILNQDLNYLMEVIKDRKDELDSLRLQYAEITDTESVQVLLSRIAAIQQEIATVSQQMADFGDLTQINTDIANLKNATNFSNTGKANIAHFAMPSNHYEEITLPESGTKYTAPADGWVAIRARTTAANGFVFLTNDSNGMATGYNMYNANYVIICNIPVASGQKIKIDYGSVNFDMKRFIYTM